MGEPSDAAPQNVPVLLLEEGLEGPLDAVGASWLA
jgi:hypothetical protein